MVDGGDDDDDDDDDDDAGTLLTLFPRPDWRGTARLSLTKAELTA